MAITRDAATFTELRKQLGKCQGAAALPGGAAQPVRHGRRRAGKIRLRRQCARGHREAIRPQPADGAGTESHPAQVFPGRKHLSASITISAKSRCRTFCTRASPIRSSSPSGTANMCAAFRSRWRRTSASAIAASSTMRPARCAMWCRTTCCRCWAISPWIRRPGKITKRNAIRKRRC